MADTEDSLPSADVVLSSMKSCGIFDEFRKTCLQALEYDVNVTNNTFACFYFILMCHFMSFNRDRYGFSVSHS